MTPAAESDARPMRIDLATAAPGWPPEVVAAMIDCALEDVGAQAEVAFLGIEQVVRDFLAGAMSRPAADKLANECFDTIVTIVNTNTEHMADVVAWPDNLRAELHRRRMEAFKARFDHLVTTALPRGNA